MIRLAALLIIVALVACAELTDRKVPPAEQVRLENGRQGARKAERRGRISSTPVETVRGCNEDSRCHETLDQFA